jgi:two-component system sensor histidine kinase AlgZ
MHKMRSIKQNASHDTLPNFRNLGITLRILLISNGLGILHAFLQANSWVDIPLLIMQIFALLVPVLLSSLLLLWAIQPWLDRLSYWRGVLAVHALPAALTLSIYYFGGELYRPPGRDDLYFDAIRYTLTSILICAFLLVYFRLRNQKLSRALHDARLQVLRARIRPHFLFNTINAVLGIVRSQPKQAETALEDMADLFRMVMSDAKDLVPLRQEISLSKQYIALEQLRMGQRLAVDWRIHDIPDEVLIPPLLLQPLLENAVYHGIEPLPQGGSITIALCHSGNELQIKIENPRTPDNTTPHTGQKMALHNIRERLELLFDVEARFQVDIGVDFYRVEIALPYLKEKTT